MKYSKEERLDIGRRIYNGEITRYEAADIYGICDQTARDYMRLYRNTYHLPSKSYKKNGPVTTVRTIPTGMEDLESMTKEELIQEIVKERITEARLKKGYEVKGDGSVILYDSKNIK